MGDEISVNPGEMMNYWTEADGQADEWQTALTMVRAALTAFRTASKPDEFAAFDIASQEEAESQLGQAISWSNAVSDDMETLADGVLEADNLEWDDYRNLGPIGSGPQTFIFDADDVDAELTVLNDMAAFLLDRGQFDPETGTVTVTVMSGESYWSITSDFLCAYYESQGGVPDDIEQQVWIWHQKVFEANKDNGVGDPNNADLIWEGAQMDVSVLFEADGPLELDDLLAAFEPAEPDPVDLPDDPGGDGADADDMLAPAIGATTDYMDGMSGDAALIADLESQLGPLLDQWETNPEYVIEYFNSFEPVQFEIFLHRMGDIDSPLADQVRTALAATSDEIDPSLTGTLFEPDTFGGGYKNLEWLLGWDRENSTFAGPTESMDDDFLIRSAETLLQDSNAVGPNAVENPSYMDLMRAVLVLEALAANPDAANEFASREFQGEWEHQRQDWSTNLSYFTEGDLPADADSDLVSRWNEARDNILDNLEN